MTTKATRFDCVEMKLRIQERLRAEYDSRRSEFRSYCDFLQAKADRSPWVSEMRKKFGREK